MDGCGNEYSLVSLFLYVFYRSATPADGWTRGSVSTTRPLAMFMATGMEVGVEMVISLGLVVKRLRNRVTSICPC